MNLIIDASGMVLGRVASYAAKQALLGRTVIVINAEKALVSGKRELILRENLNLTRIKNLASLRVGPYHYKRPDKFVRKTIRGMLPYDKPRGAEAYTRVMVYIGEPVEEIKRDYGVDVSKEKKVELSNLRKKVDSYLTVGEICKFIGGKW